MFGTRRKRGKVVMKKEEEITIVLNVRSRDNTLSNLVISLK